MRRCIINSAWLLLLFLALYGLPADATETEAKDIAYDFKGVNKAYAIQAGRELRVMVESDKISDDQAAKLSFQISQKIQTDMTYPGQVKVTVIRETRAVNIAK